MLHRFTTGDGLSLAYMDEPGGPGAPLLCLAGLTRCHRDFDRFAEAMNGRRRLIRLDARGRGASDRDPDFNNYNPMVEAGDALALLDLLGVDRAIVVGSSRGGLLAMTVAATRPERLAGAILNDVGPVIEPGGVENIMNYLGKPPRARTLEEAARGLEAALGAAFSDVDPAFWREQAERSFVETEDGLALAYDPHLRDATLAQIEAAGPEPQDLWPLFDLLAPIPTLVLRGANSDLLSVETVAQMKARKPDLQTAEIPNRGHIPRLDEPASLAAIGAFLDRLDG